MEERKIQLVITLYSSGGAVPSVMDNRGRHLQGKASSSEILQGDFASLGLIEEADSLKREQWPKPGTTKDVVFEIPETETAMERLGFRENGSGPSGGEGLQ